MTARRFHLLIGLCAFVAATVLAFGSLFVLDHGPAQIAPGPAAIGGPFQLTDQNGRAVTDQDLKGHPFLVFFGFTHCPDVCPTTLFEVSEVLRALGPYADKVNALFVTVE